MTRIRNQERLVEQAKPKFGREFVLKSLQQTLKDATIDKGNDTGGNINNTLTHNPVPVIVDSIVAAVSGDSNDNGNHSNIGNSSNSKPNNVRTDGEDKRDVENMNGDPGGEVDAAKETTVNANAAPSGIHKSPMVGKAEERKGRSSTSTNQQQPKQQHRRQQKVVLLSGHTGLSMKKLCDMAYNSPNNNSNFGESRSCWYTWTKILPMATTIPNKARRHRVHRPSFDVPRYSYYGSMNHHHYQNCFSEIAKSLSQIVTQINSLGDDGNHYAFHTNATITRDVVVKKLRSKLTVIDTLHLIQFCPEIEKLFLYSERAINIAQSQERFKNVTGIFSKMKNNIPQKLRRGKHRNDEDLDPTERLIQLVRWFIQAVGDIKPIVWAFEDVQFGVVGSIPNDKRTISSSLSFMKRILNQANDEDSDNINIIFVGTIRQDKIKKADPNFKQLQDWLGNFDDVLHLYMKNMTKDNIASMLQDALRTDAVDDLAELFYQRTNGNDYFVLQLLDYLEQQELLTFSTWTYQWQWDIDEIKRQSMVTDNVLASIEKRFLDLTRPVQRALQLASHIGYRFDEDLLDKVLRSQFVRRAKEMKGYAGGKTRELLNVALDGNFIERIDADEYENRYKFVHLQVQTACREWFGRKSSKKALQKLHWNVGTALWRGWRQNETYQYVPNRVIFPCVKEITLGQDAFLLSQSTRRQIIRLNHEAAKRSYAIQSYFPAVSYLECAVRLLNNSDWDDDYALTLDLHTALAQMYLASGKLQPIPRIVNRIQLKAKDSEDKLPIDIIDLYWCKMVGRLDENVNKSVDLINSLGVHLRSYYFNYQSERKKKKLQKLLHTMTDEDIREKCNNPSSYETGEGTVEMIGQQLVYTLMYPAGFEERPEFRYQNLASVVCCKLADALLMERSHADSSALTLTLAAAMFSNDNNPKHCFACMGRRHTVDLDLSIRLMDLALSLPVDEEDPRIIGAFGLIKHWRVPLTQCTEWNLKGYGIGMRSGNLRLAFQCAAQYVADYFMAGLPLDFLLKDLESILSVMIEYGQKYFCRKFFPYLQVLLNITGQSEAVLDVDRGNAIDRMNSLGLRLLKDADDEKSSVFLTLLIHCQEYGKATKIFEELKDLDVGLVRFHARWHTRVFSFALTCIHNAQDIRSLFKRRYWTKLAKKYVGMIKIWVEDYKAINLGHKLGILQAAMLPLQSPSPTDEKLISAFDEVIVRSARSGFLQDAALSAVLASKTVTDDFHKKQYATRAMEHYSSWDARGIMKHLIKTHRHFRIAAAESNVDVMASLQASGAGVKGRARFSDDDGIMKVHRSLNAAEDEARKQTLLPSDAATEASTRYSSIPLSKPFSDFPGMPSSLRKSDAPKPSSIHFQKRKTDTVVSSS